MRFLTLDWYYPEAFEAAKRHPDGIFHFSHGTSDYLDIALRVAGHEAETVVVNADPHWQIKVAELKPTHIISQNIGMWGAYEGSPLSEHRRFHGCKLIGFCSYAAVDQTLTGWDAMFSSFNWMPEYCEKLGQKCHYLPLAFGKPVLQRLADGTSEADRCRGTVERDIPVTFIGGLGSRIWNQGTKTMAAIAEAVPEFQWWGYKVGDLPPSLDRTFQGAAWGLDYHRILARTKILVNRHGEIAKNFANNMRTFEGPGVGCYLLSDCDGAFSCNVYSSAEDAVDKINKVIETWDAGGKHFAEASQRRVLANHTYEARVPRFLQVVESL